MVSDSLTKSLSLLQDAAENNKLISFEYQNNDGDKSKRTIQPEEFFTKGKYDTQCVRGYCHLRKEDRSFAVERMHKLKIVNSPGKNARLSVNNKIILDTLSLDEQIIEVLKNQSGLKAADISNKLNNEKNKINNLLYGTLKEKCVQDEKYRWYLKEDAPNSKKCVSDNVSKTALSDLCHYYLRCLGYTDEGGVSVFADNKYGDFDYAQLKTLPINDVSNLFESDEAKRLLGKIRKDRSRLELYMGYPCTLKKIKSKKSSWEGYFVEPIILYPVEVSDGTPKINRDLPMFNLSVIKRYTNSEREQIMYDLAQLEDELGLNAEEEPPELDDLVRRLKDIRPEWPWKEAIVPTDLSEKPPLNSVNEEGIFNRAVLVVGERSPFTQGAESELRALADLPLSEYENTALGHWVKGQIPTDNKPNPTPLIEVLPLNSEQRQAIKQSLESSLTIITGPPGTGKSQVVTDLIVNAEWQGKKVLFASKNNKAVDVVEMRVNSLGPRPVLLRMGSSQYQSKLAEYLMGLLSSTSSEHDKEEFGHDQKRYKQLEEKLIALDRQEKELVRLRNETDELDQSVEKIRQDISGDIFEKLRSFDFSKFDKSILSFQMSFKRATREEQDLLSRLLWFLMKHKRYKNLSFEISNVQPIFLLLKIDIPKDSPSDTSINSWKLTYKTFNTLFLYAQKIKDFHISLKLLQKTRSLEDISKEKIELLNKLAKSANSLWKGWLHLRPSGLSIEDRQLLNKYNALLKMVIDAGSDLYTKLGKKVYQEYASLSKKVRHLFPAWAVTSLSAKGKIPFEGGYFDLVVFDESSQCDIASAIPLLYRAKHAVIIGDPKQLSHISGLQRGQDQQLLEKHNLIPDYAHWAYSYNSLFALASGFVSSDSIVNLRDHHRSHADIIEFSNSEFYEGNLRVATNYDRLNFLKSENNGVRWIDCVGSVKRPSSGGAINENEAKVILKELERLVLEQKYSGSIGVVTPFRAQANYIRKLVNDDNNLSSRLVNHKFLVDTVHKFQGDERDIMIFSPVLSKNMPQGSLIFLNNNGNLFNVAITRARATLIVIGDLKEIMKCDVSYLSNFAKYTQKLKNKIDVNVKELSDNLGEEYPVVANPDRVSEWEHIFYKALRKNGIKVIPQYQVEKYTLDLALFDGKRMLDIEVDGERYHRNWDGELCRRDQIRNQRLFELGWDVKRFWVYEIRDEIDKCVSQIKKWQK